MFPNSKINRTGQYCPHGYWNLILTGDSRIVYFSKTLSYNVGKVSVSLDYLPCKCQSCMSRLPWASLTHALTFQRCLCLHPHKMTWGSRCSSWSIKCVSLQTFSAPFLKYTQLLSLHSYPVIQQHAPSHENTHTENCVRVKWPVPLRRNALTPGSPSLCF